MVRESLISAIRSIVEQYDYTFYTGIDATRGAVVEGYPVAWLSPLRIVAVDGHRDCRVTYRVKLCLAKLDSMNFSDREGVWNDLECDALALYHSLPEAMNVEWVDNFSCTPCSSSLMRQGDLSVEVQFDVNLFYCI